MVKSGEVYYGTNISSEGGFLHGRSDRPRNIMNPSNNLCGNLTMIQSCLWNPIKNAIPAFVQGFTKDDTIASFKGGCQPGWKSISLDGSGFDSTQNYECMDAVDNKFFRLLRPGIISLLETTREKYPNLVHHNIEDIADKLILSAVDNDNYCFTRAPEI